MRPSYLILIGLVLSSVLLLTEHGTAQSVYGQVSGRLLAVAGTPVSGAAVSVTSIQTGTRVRTKSDTGGYFNISNLGPDQYQIDVQADGFKRVQGTIVVNADSTTSVNASLQAGDPSLVAQPTAVGGGALKLDRTDVSTLFDSRTIEDLPLVERNVTRLELLVPGAARGKLFIPANQNPQNGQPININGQHFSGSAFQLDGTENRDPLEGIVVINPTVDSVREMKVTTQGYNAEFGQATAGVVTIQTKSGSNAWHGDAFGFRQTGWGQSQDPFAPAGVPPSKRGIFGGSFGGPIKKNKLFVFGDYQGTRSSEGTDLLLNVPTQHVRDTCVGPNGAGAGTTVCDLSEYSGVITGTLTDKEGNPFPGNQIPNTNNSGLSVNDHFVSSQAAALLTRLPAPNNPAHASDPNCPEPVICDNFLASGQESFNSDQFDVRSDYNASSALRLFGRYSFGQFYDNGTPAFGSTNGGGIGTNQTGFAGVARTRNQGISTGFTYTLGPKTLTDFRFGYFRYRLNVNAQDQGQTPSLGIPGIFNTGDPFATGLPDFDVPGQANLASGGDYFRLGSSVAANDCSCPLREREQQFQFVNNWTRSAGQHIVKWGADLRFLRNYRLQSDRPRTGYFVFGPAETGLLKGASGSGLGLATFLIGDVSTFLRTSSQSTVTSAGEHQKRFGFYGQDAWRINSRFTLTYGLRWEIYFPQTVTGAGGFLLPNLNDHMLANAIFKTPAASDTAGGVSGNFTNLAPRVGFAYLINPSTVVRAGYGRSFDAGFAGDLFGVAATQNPPVTANQDVEGVFNLADGPPSFHFPTDSRFSLFDIANDNFNNPNPPAGVTAVPSSGAVVYALPAKVRVPTVDSWNLTFQHELTSHLYFEIAYVGNKGTHVFAENPNNTGTAYDLNQPSLQNLIIPAPGPNYSNCKGSKKGVFTGTDGTFCLAVPSLRSFYQPAELQPDPCLPAKTCFVDPSVFEVRYFGNNANDTYNSLQAKMYKNFNRGYSFMAHYTWSKGLDYAANYFRVDPRKGYGPADFDTRHRFVMTNVWDLPIGRGRAWLSGVGPAADRFVGGWTISAITIWRSGLPFTPSYAQNACGKDTDPGDPCRPNLVGPVHILGTREQYFTTTGGQPLKGTNCNARNLCGVDANHGGQPIAGQTIGPWQRPGAGLIGTAGRNSIAGPGFFQSDVAVAKTIAMTERASLHFRADVFNVFNKVNLANPNGCVDCQSGGIISSLALGGFQREFQFSLRIQF